MARSQPIEAPERSLEEMVLTETVTHPQFGFIYISATVDPRQVWAVRGDQIPTIKLCDSGVPSGRSSRVPFPVDNLYAAVQFNKWEHSILPSSAVPFLHRRWLAREVRLEGRRYVRRAHGSGSVIERDGYGVVLSAARRMYKGKPWRGELTPLADPLDASLALVWDRAVHPSDLTFF